MHPKRKAELRQGPAWLPAASLNCHGSPGMPSPSFIDILGRITSWTTNSLLVEFLFTSL